MSKHSLASGFVLCVFLLVAALLGLGPTSGNAQIAQPTPTQIGRNPQGTFKTFLPIIMKSGATQVIKTRSGIHLGNRTQDWPSALLQRIQYRADGSGIWPAAVMVLSNQVYHIPRILDPNSPDYCRVQWWSPAGIKNPNVFNYLKLAAQAGTKVIVRLYPSPGNFFDYDQQGWPYHHLSSGGEVGPRTLCNDELDVRNEIGKLKTYRWAGDLVDEMASIHRANQNAGWTEYGFEPANEPNLEWYDPPNFAWGTRVDDPWIWVEMDDYFVAVWNYHTQYAYLGDFRILAPPMDQDWYSIGIELSVCESRILTDGLIGYDYMAGTYSYYFDGYDWHNYWKQGNERYVPCGQGGNIVSYYFRYWLKDVIAQKGGNITEADLASYPWQMRGTNPLHSKRDSSTSAAVTSLRQFVLAEPHASRILIWLLNDNTGNVEHDWHEAYDDNAVEYPWFTSWWLNPTNSP